MKFLIGFILVLLMVGCAQVVDVSDQSSESKNRVRTSSQDQTSDESSSVKESSVSKESSNDNSSTESVSSDNQNSSGESTSESSDATQPESSAEASSASESSATDSSNESTTSQIEIVTIENTPTTLPELTCVWGTVQVNICDYSTQDEMVEAFLNEMTTDEKIGQMTQTRWFDKTAQEVADIGFGSIIHTQGPTPGATASDWVNKMREFQEAAVASRLGIPLLIGVDAVHGQNTFEGATLFPHNSGMAATRNMALIEQAARVTAREVAGTGFNWTFSPCIAMPQNENWGRVYEGYTEDTELTTQSVIASIKGHHQGDLAQPYSVATTAKHFIGDGATDGGHEGGNAIMSDDEMRSKYLPPYAAAVDEGVASVMVGFNSLNGINMHQNGSIVNGVLKGELGFKGVIVTDWMGGTRYGAPHTVVNAGVDIAMQPDGGHTEFMDGLRASVGDGTVSMDRIDDAVRRILNMKFNLGLFRDPYPQEEFAPTVGSTEHRKIARQAVRESMILFKNEGGALPLNASEKIAIVGEFANSSGLQSGGWSINWQGTVDNYAGATNIKTAIQKVAPNAEFAEAGCYDSMDADKAVVVVGETPYAEFMGDTYNTDFNLWMTVPHQNLIKSCAERNIQTIVILVTGRALAMESEMSISDAFVAAWYIGSEGDGVADFLFGTDGFQPRGKTAYSWPKDITDLPLAPDAAHALFKFGDGMQQY